MLPFCSPHTLSPHATYQLDLLEECGLVLCGHAQHQARAHTFQKLRVGHGLRQQMCGALLVRVCEGQQVVAQKVREQVREQPVALALLCLLERPGRGGVAARE